MIVRWVIRFGSAAQLKGRYYFKSEDLTGDALAIMLSLREGETFTFDLDGRYAILKVDRPKSVSYINGYRSADIHFVPDADPQWMERAIYQEFDAERGGWRREIGGGL